MVWDCIDPRPHSTIPSMQATKSDGAQVELQCDYNNNCTKLYTSIENENWDDIIHYLDHGSWPALSLPGLSLLRDDSEPLVQCKTIVVEDDENGGVRKSCPLHLAVMLDAPFAVVRRLCELYPQGIHWTDHNGNLALHLAMHFEASEDLIAYLLLRYPESVNETNKLGFTPLQAALKAENNKDRGMILAVFVHYTKRLTDSSTDFLSHSAMVPKKEFRCDYNINCTELYKKIEEGQWVATVDFLDNGRWSDSILDFVGEPDKVTPKEQAQTWVTRRDPFDGKELWTQLPLHIAVICGAPFSVTRRLIDLYPQAVFCADDQGMLPIHLSLLHNAKDNLVAKLLLSFPDSVNKKSIKGRTPLDCALRAQDNVRGHILQLFTKQSMANDAQKAFLPEAMAKTNDLEVCLETATNNDEEST